MSAEDDDDYEITCFTREEALAIAVTEASRALEDDGQTIRYVAFDPTLSDYCLCQFIEEKGGWVKCLRTLANSERTADEMITDSRILEQARAGNTITAIRLYRTRYETGLKAAKIAIENLLQGNP